MRIISSLFHFLALKIDGMYWGASVKNNSDSDRWTVLPNKGSSHRNLKFESADSTYLTLTTNSTGDGVVIDTPIKQVTFDGGNTSAKLGVLTPLEMRNLDVFQTRRIHTFLYTPYTLSPAFQGLVSVLLPKAPTGYLVVYRLTGGAWFGDHPKWTWERLRVTTGELEIYTETWTAAWDSGYSHRNVVCYAVIGSQSDVRVYLDGACETSNTSLMSPFLCAEAVDIWGA